VQLTAEFVVSAAAQEDFPRDGAPEIALIGRSNVGKSSLINALVRSPLARTSAAPGKTRLINFYRVRAAGWPVFYFADLPGYGYARGGAPAREIFERMADAYFGRRDTRPGDAAGRSARRDLACALLVIDARRGAEPRDHAALAWVQAAACPAVVAVSKLDKLTRRERTGAERQWTRAFDCPVIPVSAATGEGLKDLWSLLAGLIRKPV
jgi:GTP-binding protein